MILKITITYFIICVLMGIISLVLSVFDVEVGDRLAHLTIVFGGIGRSIAAIVGLVYTLWTIWT